MDTTVFPGLDLHKKTIALATVEERASADNRFYGTQLALATCGSIRLKQLKIGTQVIVSLRRVREAIAAACPAHHPRGQGEK